MNKSPALHNHHSFTVVSGHHPHPSLPPRPNIPRNHQPYHHQPQQPYTPLSEPPADPYIPPLTTGQRPYLRHTPGEHTPGEHTRGTHPGNTETPEHRDTGNTGSPYPPFKAPRSTPRIACTATQPGTTPAPDSRHRPCHPARPGPDSNNRHRAIK